MQASHAEPAAPVMPPKSEVPTAEEESPVPGFEPALPDSETPAVKDQLQLDLEPSVLPPPDAEQRPEPRPPTKPSEAEPSEDEPTKAKPSNDKPSKDQPAEEKPAKEKSDDANLFDEANLRQRSQQRLVLLGRAALQQELLRQEALRQQATRLMQSSAAGASVKQATHVEPVPSRPLR